MTEFLSQEASLPDTRNESEDTIASRFERQVAAVPHHVAIVTDGASLTYREVDQRANRIAAGLASLPSALGKPIALLVKDETFRVAAILGTFKACRILIPLSLDFPREWVSQVIEDAGAAHIIVDSSTRTVVEHLTSIGVTILDVEDLAASLKPTVVDRTSSADDPAYIIYTSGSTGRPKGVVNSHRSFTRRGEVRYAALGLSRSDRYANVRSGGVSSGFNNTLMPLLVGACLFPFDLHQHGLHKLSAWLLSEKITYISFSGSMLRTWLASLSEDARFPSLRFIRVGGERLYGQDVLLAARHLQENWGIGHSYSSTESGLIAGQVFTPSNLPEGGDVTVGHPVDGIDVWIEDESGACVPTMATGEIVVRSRYLSLGYWNNPELTAKAFRPDPRDSAMRIYRTGDLGRLRPDGALEHVGRTGTRVKVRGFTVDTFEVECALQRLRGVRNAAVVLRKDVEDDEPRLVGYVAAPSETSSTILRNELVKQLPPYMVPTDLVVLDFLPVRPSGKLDRNALPAPRRATSAIFPKRTASDGYEKTVSEIWQQVLKRPNIAINDDFYELGGTSLQAFLIFAKIAGRLSHELPPTTMLHAPTIAKQAEILRRSETAEPTTLVTFRATGMRSPLFVVHARHGDIMFVKELVRDLKSNRPVFGFQPLPLDGSHRFPQTIEDIAAHYLADLRRAQPEGPYYLAGYSWGGHLALEMAQQLLREGETVAFVGLIDSTYKITYDVPGESAAAKFKRHVGALRHQAVVDYFLHRLRRTMIHYSRVGRRTLSNLPNRIRMWLRRPTPYVERADFYEYLHSAASARYIVSPFPGHIHMFASLGRSKEQRERWSGVALGGLTVREVPAGHFDMVWPPHSTLLAAAIDECLHRV